MSTTIRDLPGDVLMKILSIAAVEERLEWYRTLDEVRQEYEEWPLDDDEYAEDLYQSIFGSRRG